MRAVTSLALPSCFTHGVGDGEEKEKRSVGRLESAVSKRRLMSSIGGAKEVLSCSKREADVWIELLAALLLAVQQEFSVGLTAGP